MCVCICVCMYVCMCVYVCTQYTYTHNIHTHTDPSDAFLRVRNLCDLESLQQHRLLQNIRVGEKLTPETQALVKQHLPYITRGQLRRCYEVLMLASVDRSNPDAHKLYRLFVKSRLLKESQEVCVCVYVCVAVSGVLFFRKWSSFI